jgi:hypothetical protein
MPSYGRGVAGGAQSGGTTYGDFEAREASDYIRDPVDISHHDWAKKTLASGGLSKKEYGQAQSHIKGGRRRKSYNVLKQGFEKMGAAEEVIGRLREGAAGKVLGDYRREGSLASKPGQFTAKQGLLKAQSYETADYKPWEDQSVFGHKKSGGEKIMAGQYETGMGGTRGRIAEMIRGRGFGGALTYSSFGTQGSLARAAKGRQGTAYAPYDTTPTRVTSRERDAARIREERQASGFGGQTSLLRPQYTEFQGSNQGVNLPEGFQQQSRTKNPFASPGYTRDEKQRRESMTKYGQSVYFAD